MKIGLAQIKPVWLNKEKTIDKVVSFIEKAGQSGCSLVVFGEATIPGYPFWLSYTGGAAFNDDIQKEIHAHYLIQAIQPEEMKPIQEMCKQHHIACYVGTIERSMDQSRHSVYCAMIYIDQEGVIRSVHRKLRPTYEERLVWSPGDGHGLRVHALEDFHVGGLNCWENWMPLARTALYGQGENLHVMIWPGSKRNTFDITPVVAKESRSFVVSVGCVYLRDDIPDEVPHAELIRERVPEIITDGGSCACSPDGEWLIEPQVLQEDLFITDIDINEVLRERQNFDPTGHYSRPDVLSLTVNRERKQNVNFID